MLFSRGLKTTQIYRHCGEKEVYKPLWQKEKKNIISSVKRHFMIFCRYKTVYIRTTAKCGFSYSVNSQEWANAWNSGYHWIDQLRNWKLLNVLGIYQKKASEMDCEQLVYMLHYQYWKRNNWEQVNFCKT